MIEKKMRVIFFKFPYILVVLSYKNKKKKRKEKRRKKERKE